MFKKYKVLVEITLAGIAAPLAVGSEVILKDKDAAPFLCCSYIEVVAV